MWSLQTQAPSETMTEAGTGQVTETVRVWGSFNISS